MRAVLFAALVVFAAGCIPENDPTQAPPPRFGPDGPISPTDPSLVAPVELDPNDPLPLDPKKLLQTVEGMRDKLKDRPRDFNVNVALGNLFYDNGKYIDAVEYFTDALVLAQPVEDELFADADASPAPVVPEGCRLDSPTESDVASGQKQRALESIASHAMALDASEKAACLRQLRPLLAGLHARRGNSWYLAGNPQMARKDHALSLKLEEGHPEALFFLGALTLELSAGDEDMIEEGATYWRELLAVAPDHPRAEIVRSTLPQVKTLFGRRDPRPVHEPDGPPSLGGAPLAPLAPGVAEAMAQVELTPELNDQLDATIVAGEALLEEERWQEALDTFLPVMPVRPSARLALGMGIALRELGKPTAERVLTQAGRMPGADEPRARFELGVLYAKTNPAQAKKIFSELATHPTLGAEAAKRLNALE